MALVMAAKPAARRALEAPHEGAHRISISRAMERGKRPRTLAQLLRWYASCWDLEVPDAIHKSEVWRGRAVEGVPSEHTGGSRLGAPAHADPFRRYLENAPSEVDEDGFYVRPMHAALSRLSRRWPMTARALFAVAQSGYDWKGVAERGHWDQEMFSLYLSQALSQLWGEYSEGVLRLE